MDLSNSYHLLVAILSFVPTAWHLFLPQSWQLRNYEDISWGAEEAGGHKHFAPAETIQNVQQLCQACAWQYQPWSVTVRQVSWSGLLVPCTQTQMLNCQIAQKLVCPQRQDLVQKGELRKAACRQIHSNTDGKKMEKAIYDAGQRLVEKGWKGNISCLRKRENEDLQEQNINPWIHPRVTKPPRCL